MCVIPFAAIGITVGLLATGYPFGFLALLGTMSLVGMMIKNAIVLLDQINIEIEEGKSRYQAVIAETAASQAITVTGLGTDPVPWIIADVDLIHDKRITGRLSGLALQLIVEGQDIRWSPRKRAVAGNGGVPLEHA